MSKGVGWPLVEMAKSERIFVVPDRGRMRRRSSLSWVGREATVKGLRLSFLEGEGRDR